MRKVLGAALAATALILLVAGVAPVFSSSQSLGFATYNISISNNSSSYNFVVNESAAQSSQSGLDIITLQVFSSQANLTYSRDVNSSFPFMFPYFPSLNNQSFSYSTRNFSIYFRIANSSSGSESFNGKTYAVSNYSITLQLSSSSGHALSANGNVVTMPSGLIYRLVLEGNQTTVQAKLLSTDLALTLPTGNSTNTGLAIAGIGGSAALAFVIPRQIRKRKKPETPEEKQDASKPSYWVD